MTFGFDHLFNVLQLSELTLTHMLFSSAALSHRFSQTSAEHFVLRSPINTLYVFWSGTLSYLRGDWGAFWALCGFLRAEPAVFEADLGDRAALCLVATKIHHQLRWQRTHRCVFVLRLRSTDWCCTPLRVTLYNGVKQGLMGKRLQAPSSRLSLSPLWADFTSVVFNGGGGVVLIGLLVLQTNNYHLIPAVGDKKPPDCHVCASLREKYKYCSEKKAQRNYWVSPFLLLQDFIINRYITQQEIFTDIFRKEKTNQFLLF